MTKRKRKKRIKLFRVFIGSMAAFLIIVGVSLAGVYSVYSKTLPDAAALSEWRADEATRIYDRNGNLLYQIYGDQKRIMVPSDKIANTLKEATIAIEDSRFYRHKGVDPKGTIRALYHNFQARSAIEGGSTITQQLAKNLYLNSSRTFDRKMREALLAIKIEHNFSKDQILTQYLNIVGYGGNAYGAEAAANVYFNKSASDLSIAEAAMLAAITKSPSTLSPYGENRDKLMIRKNLVIDRMAAQGFITAEEADGAKSEALAIKPREEKIVAPHFVMYVKQLLTSKYGPEVVKTGGLTVMTTLDTGKQQLAEQVIRDATPVLNRSRATNAGIVAIDPKNGEILAMVGSRNYFDAGNDGNVNVTVSARPPGSAFKPLVYATAFQKGPWAPGSTLFDLQTDFGSGQQPYIPNNYDNRFHGPVSIREALANSYNVPAVKMMALIGKEATINTAQTLGIQTLSNADRFGLALVIGGGDVRLLELAGAYSSFANNGNFNAPTAITKITQSGKVLYEYKPEPKQVFPPQVAYQINSILSDAKAREPVFGRGGPLILRGRTAAVKTGTTQDYRDAWTIGYTPSLVAGVWVGNNDFSPMQQGSAGAMAAAPIWNSFMTQSLRNVSDEQFINPGGLELMTVDTVTGKSPTWHTRQTRQDVFSEWQKPSQPELANFSIFRCDGSIQEIRSSGIVHSEKPDDPRWETPVLAWARSNGYASGERREVHELCENPPAQLATEEVPAVGGSDIVPEIAQPNGDDSPQLDLEISSDEGSEPDIREGIGSIDIPEPIIQPRERIRRF